MLGNIFFLRNSQHGPVSFMVGFCLLLFCTARLLKWSGPDTLKYFSGSGEGSSRFQFSAVLPTRISDYKFLSLFSKSCQNILTKRIVSDLHVVVPDDEFDAFIRLTTNISRDFWIIHRESDFLPEILEHGRGHSGWQLQQDLKIAAYRIVTNDLYIALDADILCTGFSNFDSLVDNSLGKRSNACVEYIGPGSKFFGKKNIEPTLTALEISTDAPRTFTMGWTPQVFDRRALEDINENFMHRNNTLLDYLMLNGRDRHGCTNCDMVWTEYLAYYFLSTHFGLWTKYHHEIPSPDIETGICFSDIEQPLPKRPGCLKIRTVCLNDALRILKDPSTVQVPFMVLNDHQIKDSDVQELAALLQNR